MIVIVVDDERLTLKMMKENVQLALPRAEVYDFMRADEALEFAKEHTIAISFLDIRMRGITGMELAEKLNEIQPRMNVIFCTAYDEYKSSAMDLHASGYLVKPVQPEDITREIQFLRFPLEETEEEDKSPKIKARCFGEFQVQFNGEFLGFNYQKTNELLAFLIDRNGAMCSYALILETLWEDDSQHMPYLKRMRKDLIDTFEAIGMSDAIVVQRGMLGIKTEDFDCDYFDFLAGMPEALSAYNDEYMSQYSWSEETNSELYWKKSELEK